MSIIVNVNNLQKEDQKQIVKDLIWQKSSYNPFSTTGGVDNSEPLIAYKRINDDVYIPNGYAFKKFKLTQPVKGEVKKENMKYLGKLRDYQKDLVAKCMLALLTYRGVHMAIHTGAGKTVMCSYITTQINQLTMIVVPRATIGIQWKATYLEQTNVKEENISMYGSKMKKNKNKNLDETKVIIVVSLSINNVEDELLNRVGLLILDEAHSLCCPSAISGILNIHPKYIIAATATPNCSDGRYGAMEAIAGKAYVRKRIDENKTKKVYKMLTGIKPIAKKNYQGKIDWNAFRESLLMSNERNEKIVAKVLMNRSRKILIETAIIAHVKKLEQMLIEKGIKVSTIFGNKDTYNDAEVIIGTYSKIKEGFDESRNCLDFNGILIDIVIIACPLRNRVAHEQAIGRSRANTVDIFHLIDDHGTCENQWNKDNKIVYKNLKIDIIEEDISDLTLDDVIGDNDDSDDNDD